MKCKALTLLLLIAYLLSVLPFTKADVDYNANTYCFTFPTYSTAMAFDADQTFDRAYRENDYWYFNTSTISTIAFQVQIANLLVTDFFDFDSNTLGFTLIATSGTSITKIYVGNRGEPTDVTGETTWSYDSGTHITTITRTHASSHAIVVSWSGAPGDTTPPTISEVYYDNTMEDEACNFYATMTDDISCSYLTFSWNATGSWVLDTWAYYPHQTFQVGYTKTLPASGTIVSFRFYVNDTSGNWATSTIYTFTVTGIGENLVVLLAPIDGITSYTDSQTFTYTPTFYQTIENASLWTNITSTWEVLMWNATAITNATSNSFTYTFTASCTCIWNIAVYNSTNLVFAQANRTLTKSLEPRYSNLAHSTATELEDCTFSSLWVDGDGLSGYIFSIKTGLLFENESWVAFNGSPLEALASYDEALPSLDTVVQYRFYVNDTDDFWTATSLGIFTTTSGIPLAPDFSNWWQWLIEGDLLGFLQAIYVTVFGSADVFYGLVFMLISGAILIRTRSLVLLTILYLLVGPFLIVAVPFLSGLGILLSILGVGGLLFELFRPRSTSY
jgi:hypothetical protein